MLTLKYENVERTIQVTFARYEGDLDHRLKPQNFVVADSKTLTQAIFTPTRLLLEYITYFSNNR